MVVVVVVLFVGWLAGCCVVLWLFVVCWMMGWGCTIWTFGLLVESSLFVWIPLSFMWGWYLVVLESVWW